MAFCSNCGSKLSSGDEKYCPNCGQDLKGEGGVTLQSEERRSINISGSQGDVIGVGFTGNSSIIGKNIAVGSGTIDISQEELAKIPVSEYAKALDDFSKSINEQLKGRQVPEEHIKEIKEGLDELAKEVQDVKPGEQEQGQIDYAKKISIESKTVSVIQRVLNVLPEAAETAATFTPLAPFSKLIGKGVREIVGMITNRKKS